MLGGPYRLKAAEGRDVKLEELIGLIREEPWQFYVEAEGEGVRAYAWDRSCAYGFINPLGLSEPPCGQAVLIRGARLEFVSLGPWPAGRHEPRAIAEELLRLAGTLKDKVALAFSGGLDSSALAAAFRGAILINVSREGSADRENARNAARLMGVEVEFVEPDASALGIAARLYHSPMDMALFSGFYAVSRRASELGARRVMAGQMADELFGGYRRHQAIPLESLADELNRDFVRGRAGLMRDARAVLEGGCEALFPYAAGLVPGTAMSLAPELRVNKRALREAAVALGLPEEIAKRKKKAFQYGSGIERLVKSYLRGLTGT